MKQLFAFIGVLASLFSLGQNKQLVPYKKGKFWGYADTSGQVIVSAVYDTVYFFDNGQAKVRKNKLEGIINDQNKVIIPPIYSSCAILEYSVIENDMVRVKRHYMVGKAGKKGIVDASNQLKVPIVYSDFNWNDDQICIVKKNNLYGVIRRTDSNYKLIIAPIYTSITYFSFDGYFACKNKTGESFFDEFGKAFSNQLEAQNSEERSKATSDSDSGSEFDSESYFKNRPTSRVFKVNQKYGVCFIDNGNFGKVDSIPALYDSIAYSDQLDYNNWFLVVQKDKKWGVVDHKGNLLLPFEYDFVDASQATKFGLEGFRKQFWVKKEGKWGLVAAPTVSSLDFKPILPFVYDSFQEYGRDFLVVEKNGKFGVYNMVKRTLVVPEKYSSVSTDFVYSGLPLILFWAKNEKGIHFLVGENGVEFFSEN